MKLNLIITFAFSVTFVRSLGLNEEFTWTRITYTWPNGVVPVQRSGFYGKPTSNVGNKHIIRTDSIVFEGETNTNEGSYLNQAGPNSNITGTAGSGTIDYQYVNNIPMGANVWRNKLFITVPRRRLGVPSTLNYVPLDSPNKHNVPLIPYPNWDINLYPDTSGRGENFVSIYRVAVDTCDRLWFMDTGIIETLGNRTQVKPAEIVVMDLQTDRIINRYNIPQEQLTSSSAIAFLAVDVTKQTCDDAYAYLPDLAGYLLLVYSLKQNRSWRVNHNYFYLEPQAGEFRIAGHEFQWNDGIFSVELTDIKPDRFRDLYFHSMSGTHIYKVSTRVLRNETLATRSYHGDDFVVVGDKGPNSQTSAADIHKSSNVMFMGLVNQNALGCWNINNDLSTISVVQRDDQKMIYPCDVKVYDDKVYVLTNGMPEFLYGRLNYDETNFRVWSSNVKEAVRGTNCENRIVYSRQVTYSKRV